MPRPAPDFATWLRLTAERHRREHVSNLSGRCVVDGQPHPCYSYAAAGVVLGVGAEATASRPSRGRAALLVLTGLTVGLILGVGITTLWPLWT